MSSHSRAVIAANVRAHRKRQAEAGNKELTLHLPSETVALIDEIKARRGMRNRSQALLQLIEQGRDATQQTL